MIKATMNTTQLTRKLEALQAHPARTLEAVARAMNDAAVQQRAEVAKRAPGGITGVIGKSVQVSATAKVGAMRIVIGSAHPGARILHTGGTIKPGSEAPDNVAWRADPSRTPKALAIPLGKHRRPGGHSDRPKDFAGLPGVFVLKHNGKVFLVQKAVGFVNKTKKGWAKVYGYYGGKRVKSVSAKNKNVLDFLFLLVKSVTIKARPYFHWTAEDKARTRELVRKAIDDTKVG